AANAARAPFERIAEFLQHRASRFIVSRAIDLASVAAFLHADRAAWQFARCSIAHGAAVRALAHVAHRGRALILAKIRLLHIRSPSDTTCLWSVHPASRVCEWFLPFVGWALQ